MSALMPAYFNTHNSKIQLYFRFGSVRHQLHHLAIIFFLVLKWTIEYVSVRSSACNHSNKVIFNHFFLSVSLTKETAASSTIFFLHFFFEIQEGIVFLWSIERRLREKKMRCFHHHHHTELMCDRQNGDDHLAYSPPTDYPPGNLYLN